MANALCIGGMGMLGAACYAIHPAVCAGFAGAVMMFLGVHLHRRGTGRKGQS